MFALKMLRALISSSELPEPSNFSLYQRWLQSAPWLPPVQVLAAASAELCSRGRILALV